MVSDQELKNLKKKEKLLAEAAEFLKVQETDLPRVVKRFLDEIAQMDKQLKA